MLDSLGDYEDMPDWAELGDALLGQGLTLNPSELHGAVCGLLGAEFRIDDETQRDAALAVLEQALAVDLHGDAADLTRRLLAATLSAVRDTDFAFQPLLPDDDEEFEHRLASVGRWASGFLTGFTQAVSTTAGSGYQVPPQAAETLKDFAAIAQIDSAEEASDDGERELEELIEYTRIAALSVVTDALNNQD